MLNININIDEIIKEFGGLEDKMRDAVKAGVETLALQTYTHVQQEVKDKLHSRREMFEKELKMTQEQDGLWSIVVPQKVLWIEEGLDPYGPEEMLKGGKGVKTSKDGNQYKIIPFQHNKGPTEQTPFANSVTDMLKNNLKKMGVNYQKLDTSPDGKPKIGKRVKLDLGGPKRPHWTSPILDGVTIFQNMRKGPDGKTLMNSKGTPKVFRDIMTFRVVSSKHIGTGKWDNPGVEGKEFLDEAYQWALDHWENEILPSIIKNVTG